MQDHPCKLCAFSNQQFRAFFCSIESSSGSCQRIDAAWQKQKKKKRKRKRLERNPVKQTVSPEFFCKHLPITSCLSIHFRTVEDNPKIWMIFLTFEKQIVHVRSKFHSLRAHGMRMSSPGINRGVPWDQRSNSINLICQWSASRVNKCFYFVFINWRNHLRQNSAIDCHSYASFIASILLGNKKKKRVKCIKSGAFDFPH